MAMRKVKYNDSYIYIDDEVDEKETGVAIRDEKDPLEDTLEIKPITDEDLLGNTMVDVDLFGGKDEE